jgi:hypothetical protein
MTGLVENKVMFWFQKKRTYVKVWSIYIIESFSTCLPFYRLLFLTRHCPLKSRLAPNRMSCFIFSISVDLPLRITNHARS